MTWWCYLIELLWWLQEILNTKHLSQLLGMKDEALSIYPSLLILDGVGLAILHYHLSLSVLDGGLDPSPDLISTASQSLWRVIKTYQFYHPQANNNSFHCSLIPLVLYVSRCCGFSSCFSIFSLPYNSFSMWLPDKSFIQSTWVVPQCFWDHVKISQPIM